jgi:hypothetical protein
MVRRRLPKKEKIIVLLKQGETSSVIIANKVHSSVAYVNHVKNQLLVELIRLQEAD